MNTRSRRARWGGVAVLLTIAGALTATQTQTPSAAPQAKPSTTLAQPIVTRLSNGMQVVVAEDHRKPISFVQLELSVSTVSDPPDGAGMAEAVSALLRAGTASRSVDDLKAAWALDGGVMDFEAEYGARALRMYRRGTPATLDAALDVLQDMVTHSTFSDEAVARWKQDARAARAQARESSSLLAEERFRRTLYGADARGAAMASPAFIDRVTRAEIVEFARTHIAPDRTIIGVIGDFNAQDVVKMVENRFGGWTSAPSRQPTFVDPPAPPPGRRVRLVNRPGSAETYLLIGGGGGVAKTEADYIPALVLNDLILARFGAICKAVDPTPTPSKLLRSRFTAYQHLQYYSLTVTTPTERTGAMVDRLFAELRNLRGQTQSEADVRAAADAAIALYTGRIQLSNFMIHTLLDAQRAPRGFWENYVDRLAAVTPAEMQAAAVRRLPEPQAVLVAVGDGDRIRADLARYGDVEEYDVDGVRVPPRVAPTAMKTGR